jgi:uncharacterized protein (TIGR02996 family)
MSDDDAFLRAILVNPDDETCRLVYADWLEERGDGRGPFLRLEGAPESISYVAWLQKNGSIDYYLQNFPEVRREAEELAAKQLLSKQRDEMSADMDRGWLAFMNTLGRPFRPFFFFNNHGNPRECHAEELPFTERIGTRGLAVTFESAFRDERSWDAGLMHDLSFLCQLELTECAYGAASCPIHPFVCEVPTEQRPLTGTEVLRALKSSNFCSRHISNLDATNVPFPGYHPGDGTGVQNDEIHNDFANQYIFPKEDEETQERIDDNDGTHGLVKRAVVGGQLWYVVRHTVPQPQDEFLFSNYVILFAVGLSLLGNRLIGVVTHQVCHNLCD